MYTCLQIRELSHFVEARRVVSIERFEREVVPRFALLRFERRAREVEEGGGYDDCERSSFDWHEGRMEGHLTFVVLLGPEESLAIIGEISNNRHIRVS